jgi:hypothetical protein
MRTVSEEALKELRSWIRDLDFTRQSETILPDLGDALQYAIHMKDCDAILIVWPPGLFDSFALLL